MAIDVDGATIGGRSALSWGDTHQHDAGRLDGCRDLQRAVHARARTRARKRRRLGQQPDRVTVRGRRRLTHSVHCDRAQGQRAHAAAWPVRRPAFTGCSCRVRDLIGSPRVDGSTSACSCATSYGSVSARPVAADLCLDRVPRRRGSRRASVAYAAPDVTDVIMSLIMRAPAMSSSGAGVAKRVLRPARRRGVHDGDRERFGVASTTVAGLVHLRGGAGRRQHERSRARDT